MSLWQALQSGPDGIRAAMRLSYEKHMKKAVKGTIGVGTDSFHSTAMFGALGSRNKVSGYPFNEPYIWIELAPFLELEDHYALEVLVEYAVWREMPKEVNTSDIEGLTTAVNRGVAKMIDKRHPALQIVARPDFAIPWATLISAEVRSSITEIDAT
jgi:hypothetical protein